MRTKLFIYGTLKRGFCREKFLAGQQFLGKVRTAAGYRLINLGSYPGLIEADDGGRIEGELWEVDAVCLAQLDVVEGVPTLYRRMPMRLEDAGQDEVLTYFYQQSIEGLPDCGTRWNRE